MAHYEEQAEKLRDLAVREKAGPARARLLNLTQQYHELADSLKSGGDALHERAEQTAPS
jgi:hypothetical protein